MILKHYFSMLTCLIAMGASGQMDLEWAQSIGGSNTDFATDVIVDSNEDIVIVGKTSTEDFDFESNLGDSDGIAIKLDVTGTVLWMYHYGGSGLDRFEDIEETSDGGYVVVGSTASLDGDVVSTNGALDLWVLKLAADGSVQWSKTYGGSSDDLGRTVHVTDDGGYVVAGDCKSNDGDVTVHHGQSDAWVVKLNEAGEWMWGMNYGGSGQESVADIIQLVDGGFLLLSGTESNDGDVSTNYSEDEDGEDCWVVRLNLTGELLWEQNYGGTGEESAECLLQIDDENFLVCGRTTSSDYDIEDANGSNDGWIFQVNDSGDLVWSNSVGGSDWDRVTALIHDPEGGFWFAANSRSDDGDVPQNLGFHDVWIGKLSVAGEILWSETYGGTEDDRISSLDVLNDGSLVFSGYSTSNDLDVPSNSGGYDMWMVRIKGALHHSIERPAGQEPIALFPNPARDELHALNLPVGVTGVSLFNAGGQLIMERSLSGLDALKLDVSHLHSGLYLLKMQPAGGWQRVLIQR